MDKNWRIQPAQWNFESKQWGKSPTFGKVEKSDWRKECAQCHVVGFNPETLTWVEDGFGCESCHGPGGRHAAADGAKRAGTIINPSKLPFGIAAAVCGQCHTRGKSPDGKWSHPIGFKPGDDLGPQHFTIAPKSDDKAWWPSGNMRQCGTRVGLGDSGTLVLGTRGGDSGTLVLRMLSSFTGTGNLGHPCQRPINARCVHAEMTRNLSA
ncbi:MAG: hypothetical protein HYR98_08805 [Nitrospirae bacterium]|nr:hypothetical protein [Nitrospirota bacterium]